MAKSEAKEMNTMSVNWSGFDALAMDYVESERLLLWDSEQAEASSSSSSASHMYSSSNISSSTREMIQGVRKMIEAGNIDGVLSILTQQAPFVLEDQHLLFRLQKQKFIELLRSGDEEARNMAISCCRTALGPCALNAYPEAYEEFKRIMLAFIYDKDDKTSPVAEEWSEERRFELAALMTSTLKACLRAYDPCFSQTLKYLLSIQNSYYFRQNSRSPISDVSDKLLLQERDPPATLRESLYEASQFNEVDVQALAHSVELPRQGAIDSLRYTDGDLFAAFQNELSRMKLNVPMLDDLVREYCVYRGLVDPSINSPSGSDVSLTSRSLKLIAEDTKPDETCSMDFSTVNIESGERQAVIKTFANDMVMDDLLENCSHKQDKDVELRSPSEHVYGGEACSTSGTCQTDKSGVHLGSRPRWKGRHNESESQGNLSVDSTKQTDYNQLLSGISSKTLDHVQGGLNCNYVDNFRFVSEMRELASKGMVVKVVEEIKQRNKKFFEQNPVLLFQLKQVEFLKLVGDGDYVGALRVARSDMGPLAQSYSDLLKPLKETMLALTRAKDTASVKCISLSVLATSLQVALGESLGIEEPLLMKIIRATLYTHEEWFKLQMCTDRFEKLLRINELKEMERSMHTNLNSEYNPDSFAGATAQVIGSSSTSRTSDGSNQPLDPSRDLAFNETAILQVMVRCV
ncbi:uncharacterized protein LOC131063465 isoform X1 [Cryptomeria japonica]|uniref:uncharacterized protein LOC131063465 isoform X1 n=1 Tax=Cryptomeria japonica TaxID=3369 RepID=UPI0027DA7583|nr:uncharacterized protein LOC131063465 isoform X1 [Cryptomeria japonica]